MARSMANGGWNPGAFIYVTRLLWKYVVGLQIQLFCEHPGFVFILQMVALSLTNKCFC